MTAVLLSTEVTYAERTAYGVGDRKFLTPDRLSGRPTLASADDAVPIRPTGALYLHLLGPAALKLPADGRGRRPGSRRRHRCWYGGRGFRRPTEEYLFEAWSAAARPRVSSGASGPLIFFPGRSLAPVLAR